MLDKIKQWLGIHPIDIFWCVRCKEHTPSKRLGYAEVKTRAGVRKRISGRCTRCQGDTSTFVAA